MQYFIVNANYEPYQPVVVFYETTETQGLKKRTKIYI